MMPKQSNFGLLRDFGKKKPGPKFINLDENTAAWQL
jgi:hypothetical protein